MNDELLVLELEESHGTVVKNHSKRVRMAVRSPSPMKLKIILAAMSKRSPVLP